MVERHPNHNHRVSLLGRNLWGETVTDLTSFLEARALLSQIKIPATRGAWMSRATYIELGGSAESWEEQFGDEPTAYVEAP